MRIRTAAFAFLIISLSACSSGLHLKPGEIPPPTMPTATQKHSAESYIASENQKNNFQEISSSSEVARARNVLERLIGAAGYPKNSFPVHVVAAGDAVNAMAVDGASIVIYEELLQRVKSDSELAVVLGHEVGH